VTTTWDEMSARERLLALVQDETVDDNQWSDDLVLTAIELVERLQDSGEPDATSALDYLDGKPRRRLLEAILSVDTPALADALLARLDGADADEAELLIDHLRSWSLTDEQRARLRAAAAPRKGRSKLLDAVIDRI
jgi:hypothetical protein